MEMLYCIWTSCCKEEMVEFKKNLYDSEESGRSGYKSGLSVSAVSGCGSGEIKVEVLAEDTE